MSKDSLGVISGLVVMLAGVLTVWSITMRTDPPAQATATTSVAATSTAAQTVEVPLPDLPGVPPEVQRILYWKGDAQAILYGDLSDIPPVIQRVLIEYQAPLMVPTDTTKEASK